MLEEATAPLTRAGRAWRALLLALLTVLVYVPSTRGELVYDDLYLVAQNPEITSFENLPRAFRSAYWDFLDAETASRVGYYRPLASALLSVGWALGRGAPGPFHWISIATHLAAVLAAWLLAARLAGDERIGFWAALLFALHPVHVESVAWISAINVPLFGLFALLALAAWVGWRRRGSAGFPWASGACLLVSLFAKEAALAVVPIALAIDAARWIAARRRDEPAPRLAPVRGYLPFAVAIGLYYAARVATFGDWRAGFERVTTHFGVSAERLALLRVELLGGGIGLLALPLDLDLFRPFRPVLELTSGALLAAIGWILAFAAACAYVAWKRPKPWLAALLLVPAALLPTLVSVQSLGTFPLSDRFLYLAAIGFTTLVAGLALTHLPRTVALAGLALLAAGYAYRSFLRIPDWKDERALFAKAVEQNPDNPNAYWGLGRVSLNEYQASGDPARLAEARASYESAMDLLERASTDGTIFATSDDHRQANLGLGWSLLFEAQTDPFHDYETPRVIFQRVTARYPDYYMGWIGLGVALWQEGQLEAAGEALRKGLDLNPRSVEGNHNMAALLLMLRDFKGAERHYREALKYRVDDVEDLVGLARALELQGRADDAWRTATRARERALELDRRTDAADPCVILGTLSMGMGRPAEALRWLDEAVQLDPSHGIAQLRRGTVLATLAQPKEAAKALQRACELMPGEFEAFYNLSSVLLASETPSAALPALARAYALREEDELGVGVEQSLLDLAPTDPDLLWRLAAVDADRGLREKASAWAERALAQDPQHAPSHFLVGALLAEEGRHAEALPHLERAAAALGDSYEAQKELGSTLLALGRPAEALHYLRVALELIPREPYEPGQKQALEAALSKQIAHLESLAAEPRSAGEDG